MKADGRYGVRQVGSHKQFRHITKTGTVTVVHPARDLPLKTLSSIEKLKWSEASVIDMQTYIALLHKEPNSDCGVSFPDLPGCVTAGRTLGEARAFASEALGLHLEALAEDGEPLPPASTFETIMAEPENRDALAVLVEAPELLRAD